MADVSDISRYASNVHCYWIESATYMQRELFVSVARLMSNVREAGGSGSEELKKYAPPLPQQFCDSCMVVKKNPDRKIYTYIIEYKEFQFE